MKNKILIGLIVIIASITLTGCFKMDKKLVCSGIDKNDINVKTYKYSYSFDTETGVIKKLEINESQSYTDLRYTDLNSNQGKGLCDTMNSFEGLYCKYDIVNNNTESKTLIKIDYNKIDFDAEEFMKTNAELLKYLELKNSNIDKIREEVTKKMDCLEQ